MRRARTIWLCLSSLVSVLLIAGIFGGSIQIAGFSQASPGVPLVKAETVRIGADAQEVLSACCTNSNSARSGSCCAQKAGEMQRVAGDDHNATVAIALAEPEKAKSVKIELETTEGCECVAPCPCESIQPASYDICRALKFYQVRAGEVDGVDLKGLIFVAAITDSPKKMYELRNWHDALYLPEGASEEQHKALRKVADSIWRGVYREFEPRVAPLTYVRKGDTCEATIGKVGHLLTAPLLGPDGDVKLFPRDRKSQSGVAVRNHFDDGKVKWDLAGRNARIAPTTVFVRQANEQAGL